MKFKRSVILILAVFAILLIGFFISKGNELGKTKPSTITYIGIKLAKANLAFTQMGNEKLGIHCDHTSEANQSLPTIIPCSNLTSTITPKIFVGTTRFEMDHPKTPEQLARIVLEIYENKKTSTSTIVTCATGKPVTSGNLTITNSICTKQLTSILIKTHVATNAPVPAIWTAVVSDQKDIEVAKNISDNLLTVKQKISSTFFKSFRLIETAYAGGGGGGGGGDSGESDSSDTDSDADTDSVSPCSGCVCNGDCFPPYVPPCTDCSCGVNCPPPAPSPVPVPVPPPCTDCSCTNSCPVYTFCDYYPWACVTPPPTPLPAPAPTPSGWDCPWCFVDPCANGACDSPSPTPTPGPTPSPSPTPTPGPSGPSGTPSATSDLTGNRSTPGTLTLSCTNATTYSITRNEGAFGSFPVSGSYSSPISMQVTAEGNYNLTCSNGAQSDTDTLYYNPNPVGAADISVIATPRTTKQGSVTTLSWRITSPPQGANKCTLSAAAVCAGGSCVSPRDDARIANANSLTSQLTSGTTDSNDPYGASRTMLNALTKPNAKAAGKKSLILQYTTDFTLDCGTAVQKTRVQVSTENEG